MTPNGATSWLTVKQASERSGYDEQHIRRLCRKGKLRFERVGNAMLIDPDSLAEYVRAMKSLGNEKYGLRSD